MHCVVVKSRRRGVPSRSEMRCKERLEAVSALLDRVQPRSRSEAAVGTSPAAADVQDAEDMSVPMVK